MKTRIVLLVISLVISLPTQAQRLVAKTGAEQVRLLELYTSESCSSCPPADNWASSLQHAPGLWTAFVPVVFHVDYWNDLGWKDGLSSSSMTKRQRDLALTWAKPSVYTPAVIVDGKEWRSWSREAVQASNKTSAIQLAVYDTGNNNFEVHVENPGLEKLNVRIAKLGMALSANITAGENAGRVLTHNFVVLAWGSKVTTSASETLPFRVDNGGQKASQTAIAVWVEKVGSPIPLQAVGNYLESPQ